MAADSSAVNSSGFVRSLFTGTWSTDSVLPFPQPSTETRETTDEIVRMVADWAAEAIDPEAIDREKEIPSSVIEGLSELGLFGLTIPEEFDGAGLGQYTYSRMMEAVAHRCASTVTVLGAHLGIGMKGVVLYGTPEQKAAWLPGLASGERLAGFALTEASAGSDAAALRTTADLQPDGSWRINGRKIWITNGGIASDFTVFARTPHPDNPDAPLLERPISAFFVPADLPGVTRGNPEVKMGLCGSSTTELGFDDVNVSADRLLGPEGQGFKVALNVLNSGRHGLAACCIGQARLARDLAVAHAKEREQFGGPIIRFGMIQELLAGMDADIYAMEAGTWLTAGIIDLGQHESMLESACCKMYATEALWRIANDALQVTGGTGFMREYPYERIIRDARINMIFEGTNQVLRLMLSTQGLRAIQRGTAEVVTERTPLQGLADVFSAERESLEAALPRFALSSQAVVAEHGKALRSAQLPLRRLADMATALFGQVAVLSRASTDLESGAHGSEENLPIARLAFRRLQADFERAQAEERAGTDALVHEVAGKM